MEPIPQTLKIFLIASQKTKSAPICLGIRPNTLTVFFLSFLGVVGLFKVVGTAKDHLINHTTLGFVRLNDQDKAFCKDPVLGPYKGCFFRLSRVSFGESTALRSWKSSSSESRVTVLDAAAGKVGSMIKG